MTAEPALQKVKSVRTMKDVHLIEAEDQFKPQELMVTSGASYTIHWMSSGPGKHIRPMNMFGSCFFMEQCKLCSFEVGEGLVGMAYKQKQVVFVKDIGQLSDKDFFRKSVALDGGIKSLILLPVEDGSLLELGFEFELDDVPPVCLGEEIKIFAVEDRTAIMKTIPNIEKIVAQVDEVKARWNYQPDIITKPDPKDEGTPDSWVPRNPWMNRLTGTHPFNAEPPISLLRSKGFLTPATLHYVRNHGKAPDLSWHTHRIEVSGLVAHEKSISMAELVSLPTITIPVTLNCAGNRRKEQNMVRKGSGFNWGCGAVSTCMWTGVPLRIFLEHVGIKSKEDGANFVSFYGPQDEVPQGDGSYGASHSRERCMNPARDLMLAFMMNGELLHPDHGYPVRLLCPGYIGGRMIKWCSKIVVEKEECENYYHIYDNRVFPKHITSKDVATEQNIWKNPAYLIHDRNINSAIWAPAHGEKVSLSQDMYTVGGYAYNGGSRPLNRVEVTLNGGKNWRQASFERFEKMGEFGQSYAWIHWNVEVPMSVLANCGEFSVRCWDDSQNFQPAWPSWNLMGMMCNTQFRVKVHKVPNENAIWFEHPTRVEPSLNHQWDIDAKQHNVYLVDGKLASPGWMERQKKEVDSVHGPIPNDKEVVEPDFGWEVTRAYWLKDQSKPVKENNAEDVLKRLLEATEAAAADLRKRTGAPAKVAKPKSAGCFAGLFG